MPKVARKEDSQEFEEFLRDLSSQPWLSYTDRSWWPNYVFHITDVNNVARILEEGTLRCRAELADIPVDGASPRVIGITPASVLSFVRFYFRPLTPTQYHMEGLRPTEQLSPLGSYCPVPVFLLFDAVDVLTREECWFSEGGLGRELPPQLLSTAEHLKELPFQEIYHNRPIRRDEDNRRIVYHRHAEVLIPNRLDLSGLRTVACRSYAEKDTLLALLPTDVRELYQPIIRVATRAQLFFKRWTFIEEVRLERERIDVSFSPDTETPGPFEGQFELLNLATGASDRRVIPNFNTSDYPDVFWIALPMGQDYYRFTVKLDGYLAYQGDYDYEDEIPF